MRLYYPYQQQQQYIRVECIVVRPQQGQHLKTFRTGTDWKEEEKGNEGRLVRERTQGEIKTESKAKEEGERRKTGEVRGKTRTGRLGKGEDSRFSWW